jgi:hypothetical protein
MIRRRNLMTKAFNFKNNGFEKNQQQLIEIAHHSGMAEIATGIVHSRRFDQYNSLTFM